MTRKRTTSKPERIRRTPDGMWPNLTKAQARRVQHYAAEMWQNGRSSRDVSSLLLCAALLEFGLVIERMGVERDLTFNRMREIADERTRVVPIAHVAQMAIALLAKVSQLPNDNVRDAFLHELTHNTGSFVVASPLGPVSAVPIVPTDPDTKH